MHVFCSKLVFASRDCNEAIVIGRACRDHSFAQKSRLLTKDTALLLIILPVTIHCVLVLSPRAGGRQCQLLGLACLKLPVQPAEIPAPGKPRTCATSVSIEYMKPHTSAHCHAPAAIGHLPARRVAKRGTTPARHSSRSFLHQGLPIALAAPG